MQVQSSLLQYLYAQFTWHALKTILKLLCIQFIRTYVHEHIEEERKKGEKKKSFVDCVISLARIHSLLYTHTATEWSVEKNIPHIHKVPSSP